MANFYGRAGITLSGDLAENLKDLSSSVRAAAIAAALAGGEVIRARAYDNANVSKGESGHGINGEHMRDEIHVSMRENRDEISAIVGIDLAIIPYAPHQEFGPHGNAFMRRAIDETREEVHETVRSTFTAAMGANGKIKTAVRFRSRA